MLIKMAQHYLLRAHKIEAHPNNCLKASSRIHRLQLEGSTTSHTANITSSCKSPVLHLLLNRHSFMFVCVCIYMYMFTYVYVESLETFVNFLPFAFCFSAVRVPVKQYWTVNYLKHVFHSFCPTLNTFFSLHSTCPPHTHRYILPPIKHSRANIKKERHNRNCKRYISSHSTNTFSFFLI